MVMDENEKALYYYAIDRALFALVRYAGRFGRGWYFFAGGERIVAAEIEL